MSRPPTATLTGREAEIMAILWRIKTGTSEGIRAQLSGTPHDSTVRTLLRILIAKGHVLVDNGKRPAVYRPRSNRFATQKKAMRELLKHYFGGSAEQLVVHLIENESLTLEQIKLLEAKYRED